MQVASSGHPDASHSLQAAFDASMQRAIAPVKDSSFAVALSGGADSLALTLLAQDWALRHGMALVALTVDHRLRAESSAEAAQVAAQMRGLSIAHTILTPAHAPAGNNLQAAARAWRYDALAAYCRDHGMVHCLLGHHAGDNRETVAHNLARGTTADGSSGMRRVRNYRGVRFVRPLLDLTRDTLETYLMQRGLHWVEDPSNRNTDFARVRHRAQLRADAAQRTALDGVIQAQGAARAARDAALARAAIGCLRISALGYADLMLAPWRALPPELSSQLLADILVTISGATSRPRVGDTQRLVAALRGAFTRRTLHGCTLTPHADHVRITRELARVAAPHTLCGTGETFWDGRFRVRYTLAQGETFTLRALGHGHGLHHDGELLPIATPGLWHLDSLVYVPHIGMACPSGIEEFQLGFAPAKPLAAAPFW